MQWLAVGGVLYPRSRYKHSNTLIRVAKELAIPLAEGGAAPVSAIITNYNNDNNNIKYTNMVVVMAVVLLRLYWAHEI